MNYETLEQEFRLYTGMIEMIQTLQEINEIMTVDFGSLVRTASSGVDVAKKVVDIALKTQNIDLQEATLELRNQLLEIKEGLVNTKEELLEKNSEIIKLKNKESEFSQELYKKDEEIKGYIERLKTLFLSNKYSGLPDNDIQNLISEKLTEIKSYYKEEKQKLEDILPVNPYTTGSFNQKFPKSNERVKKYTELLRIIKIEFDSKYAVDIGLLREVLISRSGGDEEEHIKINHPESEKFKYVLEELEKQIKEIQTLSIKTFG